MSNNEQYEILKKERERQAKNDRLKQIAKRLGIYGGVALALVLMLWGLAKLGSTGSTFSVTDNSSSLAVPVSSSDWTQGNPLAATTMVEYSDLQCPACKLFYPIVKDVVNRYGTGLRFVYRDFPLMQHPYGQISSQAAEAAGKQGKFWEMHDLLFEKQEEWSQSKDIKNTFANYAVSLGMNRVQFLSDLDSAAVIAKVKADAAGALASGVNSTPTFFLNGNKLNLQTLNDLENAVKTAVEK